MYSGVTIDKKFTNVSRELGKPETELSFQHAFGTNFVKAKKHNRNDTLLFERKRGSLEPSANKQSDSLLSFPSAMSIP